MGTLATNLSSYYRCEEASGNLLDAHGSNTGTQIGTNGSRTGKIANGRDFIPADPDNYFQIAHAANLLVSGDVDFTISVWVNFDGLATNGAVWIKTDGVDGEFYLFYNQATGQLRFLTWAAAGFGTVSTVSSAVTITTGVWYHLLAWRDATANTINLSVNGETPVSAASASIFAGDDVMLIGGSPFNEAVDGIIDEGAFFKRVLTPSERSYLYNGGTGRSYAEVAASNVGGGAANKLSLSLGLSI